MVVVVGVVSGGASNAEQSVEGAASSGRSAGADMKGLLRPLGI